MSYLRRHKMVQGGTKCTLLSGYWPHKIAKLTNRSPKHFKVVVCYSNIIPREVDPFIGVWGDFFASSWPFGRRLILVDTSMQQALFQQQDARRLLETNQASGADGCWIELLQLLILVAHVLTKHPAELALTLILNECHCNFTDSRLCQQSHNTKVIPAHML